VPEDLLLEIGTEEIPASFVLPALADLRRSLTEGLTAARLSHGEVRAYGTPRRLAIWIASVADASLDLSREVIGPPAKVAFDGQGKPTRAAEKFAASQGVSPEQLRRIQTSKGEYAAVSVEMKGRPAASLIPEILSAAVHGVGFKKSMRWADVEQSFARPVHWIVALLGEEVLPVVFADVRSARSTYGHRFLAPGPIELRRPADYTLLLERAHVVADMARRRETLHQRLSTAAEKMGARLLEDPGLLEEVTNLVEEPHPVVGNFDPRYLDLPPEVLVEEMRSHQRYFSLVDSTGKLLPAFVAVSNTPVRDPKVSLLGYQRVLGARLADARFFFEEDRKVPLAARVDKLRRVVWQGNLGSYAEKVARIRSLALELSTMAGMGAVSNLRQTIDRAATLSKADLVTGMVGEFPQLQGVMGREYALASGESAAVAQAIYQHYLPRGAGDALPTQDAGALIGIADRLDTLSGIFAIGKIPTGAADPFGLRRACLGVIGIILGRGYRLLLPQAVAHALKLLEPKISDRKKKPGEQPPQEQVLEFFRGRLKALWSEEHRPDIVESVLSAGFDDLVAAQKRLQALSNLVGRPDFAPLAVAFKRVTNIVQKQAKEMSGQVDPQSLVDAPEKSLYQSFSSARAEVQRRVAEDDFVGALGEITSLKPAIDLFFDKVMVMAEDKALRTNRICLLREIGNLFNQVADFSRIQLEGAAEGQAA
jgi:glycyl-tRNA synthetase beta chain